MDNVALVCPYEGDCGARWCEFCTILVDTKFKKGRCPFQSPNIENMVSIMLEMVRKNLSYDKIYKVTGLTENAVNFYVGLAKERGLLVKKPKKVTKDDERRFFVLKARGMSVEEISIETGFSVRTIVRHLRG